MRPPKALSVLALTVLLFQTTGCGSWAPVQSELPTRPVPSGSDQAVQIRVETTYGARLHLNRGWMSSDSVGGVSVTSRRVSRSFPLTQVRTVEVSELQGTRTGLLVVGLVPLTLLAVAGLALLMDPVYGPGLWSPPAVRSPAP